MFVMLHILNTDKQDYVDRYINLESFLYFRNLFLGFPFTIINSKQGSY